MMGWQQCVYKVFSSYPGQIQWKRVFKTRNGRECVSPVSPHLAQSNVLVKVSGFLNVIELEIWDKLTAADSWFWGRRMWGAKSGSNNPGRDGEGWPGQVTGMEMWEQLWELWGRKLTLWQFRERWRKGDWEEGPRGSCRNQWAIPKPQLSWAPLGLPLVRGEFQDGFLNAKEFLGSTCPSLIRGASQSWGSNTDWVLGIH